MAASVIQPDQQSKAVAAVKQHPVLTSVKLADVTGLYRYMRAPPARAAEDQAGMRGPAMLCQVSSRSSCAW